MRTVRRSLFAFAALLAISVAVFVYTFWTRDLAPWELKGSWFPPPSVLMSIGAPTFGPPAIQVHVRDDGPRTDSTPLVMIHGTSSSLHTWNGWAVELSVHHRVIRMDLPGFGITGPDPSHKYSVARDVQFVRALLDSLHVKRAVLIGNSLGGQIAIETALADTALVSRLVLVDAAGLPPVRTREPLGFRLAQMPVARWLSRYVLPRSVVESSVRSVYGDTSRVNADVVDRYYELTRRTGNREAVVERFEQRVVDSTLITRMKTLHMPTLILWGDRDQIFPVEYANRMAHVLPLSRVVTFPFLGHVPQEEDPKATVPVVDSFLHTPFALK